MVNSPKPSYSNVNETDNIIGKNFFVSMETWFKPKYIEHKIT